MQPYQEYKSLLSIPKKYLNEKLVLWMLVQRYKVKFRTWRIMADEKQIGIVTSASRPIVQNGKIGTILLQFTFLSPVDQGKVSKFEGHRTACLNLFHDKPLRVTPDPEKPGAVKETIKAYIIKEIARRQSFWLKKVWDPASTSKIEIV
jgi:hypothetical protein